MHSIGLISEYVKTKGFEVKWNDRKANPFAAQADDTNKSIRLQRIESKLKMGDRLTDEEKKYLQKNAPDMYEKAVKIEKEREEYRRALARCKTEEEARAFHMATSQMLMCEASAISRNPNIPAAKKTELLAFVAMRLAALSNEFEERDKFTKKV